jgi:ATP-dependent Lhr-like helicase
MVAALSSYEKEKIKLLKKQKPTDDEKKEIKKLYKNASLVSSNGKKAMVALCGRGIGPDTASRILTSFQEDEDDFLRDILVAEINYAKTKRFWD